MSESGELPDLLARAAAGDAGSLDRTLLPLSQAAPADDPPPPQPAAPGPGRRVGYPSRCLSRSGQRLPEYLANRPLPFFLWLRHITGEKLIDSHRRHLGARCATPPRKSRCTAGRCRRRSSGSLAAWLLGRLTSPSQAAIKAETRLRVQEVLNGMDPVDREILALRHFEQLTNAEAALTLDMNESTCSSRYLAR